MKACKDVFLKTGVKFYPKMLPRFLDYFLSQICFKAGEMLDTESMDAFALNKYYGVDVSCWCGFCTVWGYKLEMKE